MSLEVVQVDGRYVSSFSNPRIIHCAGSKYNNRSQNSSRNSDLLHLRPERKHVRPKRETSGKESNVSDRVLPVPGRQHLSVQTELYLEELCDVIETVDVECETDPLLDRPPSPLFIPAKCGVDVETQIYPGELFHFDEEVEPILEAFVGQILEQALTEVIAEEELAIITDRQNDIEARRNADLAELKRLEEEERRMFEERLARLREQEEAIRLEDEMAEKIAASVFSQNYLSQLVPTVFSKLESEGYFATGDPEVEAVEGDFWPWLVSEVDNEIDSMIVSYQILDSLIEDAVIDIKATSVIHPAPEDPSLQQYAIDVLPENQTEVPTDEEEEEEEEEEQSGDEEEDE